MIKHLEYENTYTFVVWGALEDGRYFIGDVKDFIGLYDVPVDSFAPDYALRRKNGDFDLLDFDAEHLKQTVLPTSKEYAELIREILEKCPAAKRTAEER